MWKDRMKKHPIVGSVAVALVCGFLLAVVFCFDIILRDRYDSVGELLTQGVPDFVESVLFCSILFGVFLIYPAILTCVNIVGLFVIPKDEIQHTVEKKFEVITLLLGTLFTGLFIAISDIRMDAGWSKQLVNSELHQPIWSGAVPTTIVLCLVGIVGYLILSHVKLEKLPPLVVVLCMSAMYLGMAECIMWTVQTMSEDYWVLSAFPINCVLIGCKTIRYKIVEWNRLKREQADGQKVAYQKNAYPDKPILNLLNNILGKAEAWPWLALILMIPLLGILLGILVLFGQKPDAIIKAWTETADWRLSQQIAPQNAMYDEHYLCTVAAGGHESIVKPIRMGERHGHRVVVNRQLCIANAFEQILEERTPRFHRAVRHFYDTYGFPVSRVIRTKGAADVVYLLMKPLEWIFLIVIYLCDAKPENRIAVQYLPKKN